MNKIAPVIANLLSSGPVILLFAIWVVYHSVTQYEYVSFISDTTFLAALLILRDEKIAAEKTDKDVEADLRATKKIEEKVDALLERSL